MASQGEKHKAWRDLMSTGRPHEAIITATPQGQVQQLGTSWKKQQHGQTFLSEGPARALLLHISSPVRCPVSPSDAPSVERRIGIETWTWVE